MESYEGPTRMSDLGVRSLFLSRYLIYELRDYWTDEVRYVGKSTSGLQRPLQHFTKSSLNRNNYKAHWLKKGERKLGRPYTREERTLMIFIREECDTPEQLDEAEKRWIKHYRSMGARLTNMTDGGEGTLGRVVSLESRIKARNSQGKKAIHNQYGQRFDTIRGAARELNIEKFGIRRSLKGYSVEGYLFRYVDEEIPEEWKNKYFVCNNKKVVRDIDTRIEYESVKSAAQALGVTSPAISQALTGKTKHVKGHRFEYVQKEPLDKPIKIDKDLDTLSSLGEGMMTPSIIPSINQLNLSGDFMERNPEFAINLLNPQGIENAEYIQDVFDYCLNRLKGLCMEGRSFSIVKTKLEEACFFAKKAMALNLGNQLTEESNEE